MPTSFHLEDYGAKRDVLRKRLRRQRHGSDHHPSKRPRGPRFGLLRRIVRVIRGGGE